MVTIHINETQPETNANRAEFVISEGEFSDKDLAAVNARVANVGCFSGKDPTKLSLVYDAAKGSLPMIAAFRVLKERFPKARFTTYGNDTKHILGKDIDQIRYIVKAKGQR